MKIYSNKEALELLASPYAFEELGPLFVFEVSGLGAGGGRSGRKSGGGEIESALLELPAVTCGVVENPADLKSKHVAALDVVLTDSPVSASESSAIVNVDELGLDSQIKMLKESVGKNPVASLALVQLLRLGQSLSIRDRLVAESLTYSTLQSGDEFQSWLKSRQETKKGKPSGEPNDEPAVIVSRKQQSDLLRLTLNRPEKHNAYSAEMRDELAAALRVALADDSIKKVRLDANGSSFCAGGDLNEFGTTPNPATAHQIRSVRNTGWLLHQLRDRTTANVQGACIGAGIELPAFTSKITAKEDAFFQLPEISLGLIPGAGGTASIPVRIGRQKTAWLALTGNKISAEKAAKIQLIDEII